MVEVAESSSFTLMWFGLIAGLLEWATPTGLVFLCWLGAKPTVFVSWRFGDCIAVVIFCVVLLLLSNCQLQVSGKSSVKMEPVLSGDGG
jgi:hypothetical protein